MTGGGVTRREVLVAAGAAALGATAVGFADSQPWKQGPWKQDSAPVAPSASDQVAFYGDHQAGIATTPAAALLLRAFDVTATGSAVLRQLFRRWSDAAHVLTDGALLSASDLGLTPGEGMIGPADSGETRGLPAANLTVTFGLGPGVFDDRFGLAASKPAGFGALPAMRGDQLDADRSGGDVLIQVCADDAVVAFHAMRQLTRLAADVAQPRWTQHGFGATAAFRGTQTPRNLFGQKDGTGNPQPGTLGFGPVVWVQPDDSPNWLAGGSYLAVRRIRMDLLSWDRTPVARQAQVLGRDPATGAPLSGGTEFTAPDFGATDPLGRPRIAADAHVRLANPAFNGRAEMLRRGYNYDDGERDAGLVFLAYVRDLARQFTPVLRALTEGDAMHGFLTHTASAVFAIPPGCRPAGYVGDTLLG